MMAAPVMQDIERYKVAFSRPGALTAALNYYRALLDEATLHPDPSIQRCALCAWRRQRATWRRLV